MDAKQAAHIPAGRAGLAAMIERCCALARRIAERLGARPGVEILNDVVLNQTLVRFHPSAKGAGVDAAADARGADQVYWFTHANNETARRLYDRVARLTPFVKYQR